MKKKKSSPPSTFSSSQLLLAELMEHNDFFDVMVDMIPSKLYIAGHSGDDYNPKNPYYRSANADSSSKEARKAAAKLAKRRKLDPTQSESTVDKKERLGNNSTMRLHNKPASSSSSSSSTAASSSNTLKNHQSRIESLRAKLHAKLAEKQSQRPSCNSNSDQVSKRAARRAEKKKRQEEAAKRKKMSSSKANDLRTAAAHYKVAATAAATRAQDLEHLDFGRLAGLNDTSSSKNYTETNKALANLSKSKNLQKMLADAQAKKQRLHELKQSSSAADQAQAAALQWADTLKEADGQRVKDDPRKIQKALQRKAAKKHKSQKAWKARLEEQAAAADSRQQVRQHNLQARQQGGATGANLSKKTKLNSKDDPSDKNSKKQQRGGDGGRRLSRAGFEGKKREFLNSSKKDQDRKTSSQ